jgi:alpha-tubulin suppressor-like RCC1 family protein
MKAIKFAISFIVAFYCHDEAISASHGVVQVAAGGQLTCALLADRTVTCWGTIGSTQVYKPTAMSLVHNAVAVAAGEDFACAILDGGLAECWGANDDGQLGIGDNTFSMPILKDSKHDLQFVQGLAAGFSHACGLQKIVGGPSEIYCWGSNFSGELGNSAAGSVSRYAVLVSFDEGITNPPLDNVAMVVAGSSFTCAMRSDNSTLCWGLNSFGELGNGTTQSSIAPVYVKDANQNLMLLGGSLSAGGYHACGLLPRPSPQNSAVACWGSNFDGELGNPGSAFTTNPVTNPVVVDSAVGIELGDVTDVASGGDFTCAALSDGASISCWGNNGMGQLGNRTTNSDWRPTAVFLHGARTVSSLSAGREHACAIVDGNIECWGGNAQGQLGLGYTDGDAHVQPLSIDVDAPLFTSGFEDD